MDEKYSVMDSNFWKETVDPFTFIESPRIHCATKR